MEGTGLLCKYMGAREESEECTCQSGRVLAEQIEGLSTDSSMYFDTYEPEPYTYSPRFNQMTGTGKRAHHLRDVEDLSGNRDADWLARSPAF
jgi:hypothetical protein